MTGFTFGNKAYELSLRIMEEDKIDWQNRYKILEGQFENFRERATKVGDAITQKVRLELRVSYA